MSDLNERYSLKDLFSFANEKRCAGGLYWDNRYYSGENSGEKISAQVDSYIIHFTIEEKDKEAEFDVSEYLRSEINDEEAFQLFKDEFEGWIENNK